MPSSKYAGRYPEGTKFCFTLNNPKYDDQKKLRSCEWIAYCVVGKEVGECGTPHLQGYLQVKRSSKGTASAIAKRLFKLGLSSQPHYEVQKAADNDAAREYCMKDGDYVEWGTYAKGGGSRTDIDDFIKSAAEGISELELAEKMPKQYARYWKAAERIGKICRDQREKKALAEAFKGVKLTDWQQAAVLALKAQDDRKVLWLVDYEGGCGKTVLAKWLFVNLGAFYMQGGKAADVACAWKGEEYVVCDFTRDKEDVVNYSVLESFKNGLMFSPKYESSTKVAAKPCKVLVLSNWDPDQSKLSADR